MKCAKCGTKLQEGEKFCSKCGEPVPVSSGAKLANCPHCGAPLREDDIFCSKCGGSIPPEKGPEPAPLTAADSISKMMPKPPLGQVDQGEEVVWLGRRSLLDFFGVYCLAVVLLALFFVSLFSTWSIIITVSCIVGAVILVAYTFYFHLGSYYKLTNQRFIVELGFIARQVSYIELFRVRDLNSVQNFFDRLLSVGNLRMISTDREMPDFFVQGLRYPYPLLEKIRSIVMRQRILHGVGVLETDR